MTNGEQDIAPFSAPSPGAAVPKRAASLTEILERGDRIGITDDRSFGQESPGKCPFMHGRLL